MKAFASKPGQNRKAVRARATPMISEPITSGQILFFFLGKDGSRQSLTSGNNLRASAATASEDQGGDIQKIPNTWQQNTKTTRLPHVQIAEGVGSGSTTSCGAIKHCFGRMDMKNRTKLLRKQENFTRKSHPSHKVFGFFCPRASHQ